MRLTVIVALICSFTSSKAVAQNLKMDVHYSSGYEYNLFHSPETYMDDNGVMFSKEDLIKNSEFASQGVNLSYKKKNENGYWYFRGSADNTLFMKHKEANTSGVQGRFGRNQKITKNFTSNTQFRLRRENRLGLNILGDELFTVFSFKQYQANQTLAFKLSKELELEFGGEIYFKDYDPLENPHGSSLDQIEHTISTTVNYKPRSKSVKKFVKEFSVSFDHREKQYQDWVNYEIVDLMADPTNPTPFYPFDSLYTYPFRRWEYNTYRFRYSLPLNKDLEAKLDFRIQSRADSSSGDFGFDDKKVGLRLKWEKEKWAISGSTSYTARNYTYRRAEQDTIMVLPNLRYTYLRSNLEVSYEIEPGVSLQFNYDLINRGSNTTAIDRRTRREYFNTLASLGLRWTL